MDWTADVFWYDYQQKDGFYPQHKTGYGAHPASLPIETERTFSWWVRWPRQNDDNSLPPSAKVINVWGHMATHHTPLCRRCLIKHRLFIKGTDFTSSLTSLSLIKQWKARVLGDMGRRGHEEEEEKGKKRKEKKERSRRRRSLITLSCML